MGQARVQRQKKSSRKNVLKRDRLLKNNLAIIKKLKSEI